MYNVNKHHHETWFKICINLINFFLVDTEAFEWNFCSVISLISKSFMRIFQQNFYTTFDIWCFQFGDFFSTNKYCEFKVNPNVCKFIAFHSFLNLKYFCDHETEKLIEWRKWNDVYNSTAAKWENIVKLLSKIIVSMDLLLCSIINAKWQLWIMLISIQIEIYIFILNVSMSLAFLLFPHS